MTATPPKKSDLGDRTLSAVVMVAVVGTALWLGGWVWTTFVALVALGVLWEWWGLVRRFARSDWSRLLWLTAGAVYVAVAATILSFAGWGDPFAATSLIAIIISIDVGAYFAGRTFGGPKIAPAISPSKTWAGLVGGTLLCTVTVSVILYFLIGFSCGIGGCGQRGVPFGMREILIVFVAGTAFAVVAQIGDFFESWMKRRAGVKDSGKLIPGHGGLFDRTDGLLAICFVLGVLFALRSLALG